MLQRPAKTTKLSERPKTTRSVGTQTTQTHSGILAALAAGRPEEKEKPYTPPHKVPCPFNYIVLQNPSTFANTSAISEIREAWPNVPLVQFVLEGTEPALYSPPMTVLKVKDLNNMAELKAQLASLAVKDPIFRKQRDAGKVAWYCEWSTKAENPDWATEVIEAGYKWVGGNPVAMRKLEKISLKEMAQRLHLPTAPFVVIPTPKDMKEEKAALKAMAKEMVKLWESSHLAGKAVFLKHQEGGGGRGSLEMKTVTEENALAALETVVQSAGGNLHGVYMEQALNLKGHQLMQLELECDAYTLAPGGRFVWFNPGKQKEVEIGFSDAKVAEESIPKEIYEQCRAAAKKIAEESGYDNRGTCEILLSKNPAGQWSFYILEFNRRIQVEHKALAKLIADKYGHTLNVPAEQIMRAAGFPPPGPDDFKPVGPGIVVHVRQILAQPTEEKSISLPGEIKGAFTPPVGETLLAKGKINLSTDSQFGAYVFYADTWEEVCDGLIKNQVCVYGPGTELSTHNELLRKLGANPRFRNKELGCNETFSVLKDPPVEPCLAEQVLHTLTATVNPLIIHGYRAKKRVRGQPFPTKELIEDYQSFMAELPSQPVSETPFSRFLQHQDYAQLVKDKKRMLDDHGGGTVTVFPRDTSQSQNDQQSAAMQTAARKIAETYGAATGIMLGFEEGGAQYSANLKDNYDWLEVLVEGCPANLCAHSLTRSEWVNSLSEKTLEEQIFIYHTIAEKVAKRYGLDPKNIPYGIWQPYNFHAGNHTNQDITTEAMIRVGFAPIPCWAWDSAFTEQDFRGWVQRQIKLFAKLGRPLSEIRIKNAGESREWNAERMVGMVDIMREEFKTAGLDDPIIYIHNHEFTGAAATEGAKALRACQAKGYRRLVVDSAPPGMSSHNDNRIITDALQMTAEESEAFHKYNKGSRLLNGLGCSFNSKEKMLTEGACYPYSSMAGGTGSSDFDLFTENKIPLAAIPILQAVAKKLIKLGTAVTPFSEYLNRIGIAIYRTPGIKKPEPLDFKNVDAYVAAAEKYILPDEKAEEKLGGKLVGLPDDVLPALSLRGGWRTLLPRPPIVAQLLKNHCVADEPLVKEIKEVKEEARPVSVEETCEQVRQKMLKQMQEKYPDVLWDDEAIATVLGFDKIGLDFLQTRNSMPRLDKRTVPVDMTPLMASPEFIFSENKKVGDSFIIHGQTVTILSNERIAGGNIEIVYDVMGQRVPVASPDPKATPDTRHKAQLVQYKDRELGAAQPGDLVEYGAGVQVGATVKKDQPLYVISVNKMKVTVTAPFDMKITSLRNRVANEKNEVELEELIVGFERPAPAPTLAPR